ncbi:MAG: carbon-nitrogen hydrolase family protein [Pseudomonadota bacterium]
MRVALAQIAPVFLNRQKTTEKIVATMHASPDADLIAFGEALLPGYPFWVERTNGARFGAADQQRWHARYQREAVQIERGDLKPVCDAAAALQQAVYLGIMERPQQRGGHSLYASLVYIDQRGRIQSVHRKLMPTYEERLVWATGDGNGLVTHPLGDFTVGGLNCWENWMPLARAALYGQGENLHVAVWPGNLNNTEWITRFIARESRSYVLSVSGLMRPEDWKHADLPDDIDLPAESVWANGGSCIAAPDGEWLVPPQVGDETVINASVEIDAVRMARHNFDPSGHYARPDVTRLSVNRERQQICHFADSQEEESTA